MAKEIDRFDVIADSGSRYTVILLEHYRKWDEWSGKNGLVPTGRELITACGLDVTPVDDDAGIYQIIQTDEIVRKV